MSLAAAVRVSGPTQLGRRLIVMQLTYVPIGLLATLAPDALAALAFGILGLLVGATLHEGGHALAYWQFVDRAAELTIVSVALVPVLVRSPSAHRHRWVAAAGPLLPAGVGVSTVICAAALDSQGGVAFGVGLALHALGVIPGNSDGDTVWGLDES